MQVQKTRNVFRAFFISHQLVLNFRPVKNLFFTLLLLHTRCIVFVVLSQEISAVCVLVRFSFPPSPHSPPARGNSKLITLFFFPPIPYRYIISEKNTGAPLSLPLSKLHNLQQSPFCFFFVFSVGGVIGNDPPFPFPPSVRQVLIRYFFLLLPTAKAKYTPQGKGEGGT